MSPELLKIAILGLCTISILVIVYLVLDTFIFGNDLKKRKNQILSRSGGRVVPSEQSNSSVEHLRRKEVQDVLKKIEDKKKSAKKRTSIKDRLMMAGISPEKIGLFYALSAVSAFVTALIVFLLTQNILISAVSLLVGFIGVPRFILSYMIKKRSKKFVLEFGNALDIIIRGVKAGLPFNDCLHIITEESQEPVKGEFVTFLAEQKAGVPFEAALKKLYERVPLPEVNFFVIVLTIQMQVGGNIAEALQNLSDVLRGRRRLTGKVRAVSQEAKSSAAIIGALPILVGVAVSVITPGYMDKLWETTVGNYMLIGSGIWMLIGVLIMRKMINFKV